MRLHTAAEAGTSEKATAAANAARKEVISKKRKRHHEFSEEENMDMRLCVMKELNAQWLEDAYFYMKDSEDIIVNGFKTLTKQSFADFDLSLLKLNIVFIYFVTIL